MAGATKKPIISSVRVQRALRLNSIEEGRLNHNLSLMQREKMHNARLVNQNIRVVNLTLDFIQASSGESPEGIAKDTDYTMENRERLVGPCFQYGDRIKSRRFGKFRRSESSLSGSSTSFDESRPSSRASSKSSTFLDNVPNHPAPTFKPIYSNNIRKTRTGLITGGAFGKSPRSAASEDKNLHVSGDYVGPPRLGSVHITTPGFSKAGNRKELGVSDEYGERIRSAIGKVKREAEVEAEVKEEITRLRRDKRRESLMRSKLESNSGAQGLPPQPRSSTQNRPSQSASNFFRMRQNASPAKQLEVLNLKRRYHSAKERNINNKVRSFLDNLPVSKVY